MYYYWHSYGSSDLVKVFLIVLEYCMQNFFYRVYFIPLVVLIGFVLVGCSSTSETPEDKSASSTPLPATETTTATPQPPTATFTEVPPTETPTLRPSDTATALLTETPTSTPTATESAQTIRVTVTKTNASCNGYQSANPDPTFDIYVWDGDSLETLATNVSCAAWDQNEVTPYAWTYDGGSDGSEVYVEFFGDGNGEPGTSRRRCGIEAIDWYAEVQ